MLLVRWLPIIFSVTVRDSTRMRPVISTRSRSSIESSDITLHTSTSLNDAGASGRSQCCGGKSLHRSLSRHVHGRDDEKHNRSPDATGVWLAGVVSGLLFMFPFAVRRLGVRRTRSHRPSLAAFATPVDVDSALYHLTATVRTARVSVRIGLHLPRIRSLKYLIGRLRLAAHVGLSGSGIHHSTWAGITRSFPT